MSTSRKFLKFVGDNFLSQTLSETKKDALLDLVFVNREGLVGVLVQPHLECWQQF